MHMRVLAYLASFWFGVIATALGVWLAATPAAAQESGAPVPRFASLGAGEVNLRVGPGRGYPVEWVYRRRGLPVEIVDSYGDWRRIRDPDGAQGWVLKDLLSSCRAAIVTGDQIRTLFSQPTSDAHAAWRVEPGVVLALQRCQNAWCEVAIDGGRQAWILRTHLWGVYAGENFP